MQAEIDAACELIDFWRFNPYYYEQIISDQPPYSPTGMWNYVEQRPLDGFVFAVTPFNFTSIAGNLPTAPALLGNTVVWKPASSSVFSAYYIMQVLQAAGFPPGVINMVPGSGEDRFHYIIPVKVKSRFAHIVEDTALPLPARSRNMGRGTGAAESDNPPFSRRRIPGEAAAAVHMG